MNIILRTRRINVSSILNATKNLNLSKVIQPLVPSLCGCQQRGRYYSSHIDDKYELMYEAPLYDRIKFAKRLSLFAAITCTSLVPYIAMLENWPSFQKFEIGVVVFAAGAPITLYLHYFSQMYINKLYLDTKGQEIRIERFDIFGRPSYSTFHISECKDHGTEPLFNTFYVGKQKQLLHSDVAETENIIRIIKNFNNDEKNTPENSE